MIKKYNELINYDYEEEEDTQMLVVGWDGYKDRWNADDFVYLFEEIIDDNHVIVYNGRRELANKKNYSILTREEMNKYIYTNKKKITIWRQGNNYINVYFKDLPKEIRDQI